LRLAKSTVHRLAATLTAARFLEQNDETGKYRLGLALFELGSLVRARMDVADAARQKLRELLEMTGETVQLGIIDHHSVLYVYEMESRRAIPAALHRGRQGAARRAARGVRDAGGRSRPQGLHPEDHRAARGAAGNARRRGEKRLRDRR